MIPFYHPRCLKMLALLLVFLFGAVVYEYAAANTYSATEGEAWQRCMQEAALHEDGACFLDTVWGNPPGTEGDYLCAYGTGAACNHFRHYWDSGGCAQQPGFEEFTPGAEPSPICRGGCQYEATSGTYDSNSDQGFYYWDPDGEVCASDTGDPEVPDACTENGGGQSFTCDCSVDPTIYYCLGSDPDPNDPDLPNGCAYNYDTGILSCLGEQPPPPPEEPPPPPTDPNANPNPDDTETGGNDGGGDGDPDTPGTGDGTGDGDTDGDGNRDIDCNPLSNPDCEFKGSATSKGNCDAPPTCSGDPVQCAILKQTWNAQCFAWHDSGDPLEQWPGVDGSEFDEFSDEIDLNSESGGLFSPDAFLGGGSCPADQIASTAVGDVTFFMQPFCTVMGYLSYFLMFGAYLTAARIIFAGNWATGI